MADQPETIVTLEVPLSDSPDDVTAFVQQVQQHLAPDRGVRLDLEMVGRRRYLHLRCAPVAAPPSGS